MDRRAFLSGLAAAPLVVLPGASMAAGSSVVLPDLVPLKIAPDLRARLRGLMRDHGRGSPGYDSARRPYAVFDWDNTSIMNDCEETLLLTLLDTFAFRLAPEDFAKVVRLSVPEGPLAAAYTTIQGTPVAFADLAADLDADYAALAASYGTPAPAERHADLAKDERLQSLRAKLLFAYNALVDTFGDQFGDAWVVGFLAGNTTEQLQRLAAGNNDAGLGRAMAWIEVVSPAARPGRAGVVRQRHLDGLRLTPEIAAIQYALRRAGIDVFVVSASAEEVVKVFACDPRYGYGLPEDRVFGIRMAQVAGRMDWHPAPDWPITWGPGKVEAIRRTMVAERGFGPLLVFGDSDGDADMLSAFPETRLGVIVNRLKGGKIGTLSRMAVEEARQKDPRFMLQGRNETTGEWRPSAATLPFGQTAERLVRD
ncbi:haloacid dehalogenase-like hydrolase [Aquabacter spiritensis]|uniref:phosphoserine phosphatase n=1 Tax=Aquabacter spiritensis TaxID=933073 RepID=A0A4R3LX03_9HYPH|nr:HAD family hydrolase [Aquabacter spiritensis]TCT05171.1 haloacid dehalogenase-like hydrolase [Aquabacter spiritensis]